MTVPGGAQQVPVDQFPTLAGPHHFDFLDQVRKIRFLQPPVAQQRTLLLWVQAWKSSLCRLALIEDEN